MSVSITFYTIAERKPDHGEGIILLRECGSGDLVGFDPIEVEVVYDWIEIDDDGYDTGMSVGYDPEHPSPPEGNFILAITADGYTLSDNTLWCSLDEYDALFDAAGIEIE